MASETISIVVLTYNRKRLLQNCLDSLLAQTSWGDGLEVLVADDGSDDGTGDLVARYSAAHASIKWLYHEHQGISATRNMGIQAARGEIITIVADDYILDPNHIQIVLEFFRSHPDALIVRFKIVASRNDLGSRISHYYYDVSMRRRLYNQPLERPTGRLGSLSALFRRMSQQTEEITTRHELEASGAAAFRRRVFDQVGLFDEHLVRGEDSDLTQRLRARGIDVYYFPYLHVRHQYERFMLDTIRKSFETGWGRYHYLHKHAITPRVLDWSAESILFLKFKVLLNALLHFETITQLVIYSPFMVIFEATNKLGYLCAWLFSRRGLGREKAKPPNAGA
jgi:glycosyltransferase involved in cell wall biosynthesis